MNHRIGVLISTLLLAGLVAVMCSSCLLRKTTPKETLGDLVKAYVDNPLRLLEIDSAPRPAYSLFEPLMLLDGERSALLILAPATRGSSLLITKRGSDIARLFENEENVLASSAATLSNGLAVTAKTDRPGIARGNHIAVLFVTYRMADYLKKSMRVYASDDYYITEEGFSKKFGKKPRAQYSVKYVEPGEWRVSCAGSDEVLLSDTDIDAYIQKSGQPWKYVKLGGDKTHADESVSMYHVKVYGVNHVVQPPAEVIAKSPKGIVGIFAWPAFKGNSFLDYKNAQDFLSEALPQATNITDGEDTLNQMLPGNWENWDM
jgi:hypothetical protein